MRNNQYTFKRTIAAASLMLYLFFTGDAACLGQKVVLRGKVVAYENSAVRIARLTDVPREETFFVKVEAVSKGKENSEFIKVKYRYLGEENALPENLFEGKNRWKFVLFRNKECDQKGIFENQDVSLVKVDENEKLTQDTSLPCYSLLKEKLKAIKNSRKAKRKMHKKCSCLLLCKTC